MKNIDQSTAVIFDLDDTLYCEHDYVRSGFWAVAEYLHRTGTGYEGSKLYESILEIWNKEGRGTIFDQLIERFSIPVAPGKLVEVYREHSPKLSLYPDAERVLRCLEKSEIPRGIITDGDKGVQWRKIEALGLKARFHRIIVTDDLGKDCWKPSAVPYNLAKTLFGSQANAFIYVGDNPHKDFCTAKKLGFHTVRIIRENGDHMRTRLSSEYEADQIIQSLDELIE